MSLRRIRWGETPSRKDFLDAYMIETIAQPPESDNDLAESRKYIDLRIYTRGNFKLNLLREDTLDQIAEATR